MTFPSSSAVFPFELHPPEVTLAQFLSAVRNQPACRVTVLLIL